MDLNQLAQHMEFHASGGFGHNPNNKVVSDSLQNMSATQNIVTHATRMLLEI
jgi:hypothetical protein